jgi:hypothetical protein
MNRGVVELDRFAAQQVRDADVANPGQVDLATDDLVDPGDDLGRDAGLVTSVDDLPDGCSGCPRQGNEHLPGFHACGVLLDLLGSSEHGQALHDAPDLHLVVVEKSDRLDAEVGPNGNLLGDVASDLAGADDQGAG